MRVAIIVIVVLLLVLYLFYELVVWPAMNMTEPMKWRRPPSIRKLWNH